MAVFLRIFMVFFLVALPVKVQASTLESQEQRAQKLFAQIHCVVCNGQALAGSQAPLARAMRDKIREDIAAGLDDQEIKALLQRQYGDKILMSPPLRMDTLALWLLPGVLFALGAIIVVTRLTRQENNDGKGEKR